MPPPINPEVSQLVRGIPPGLPQGLLQAEIAKAIVGHEEIIDGVLTCLFVGAGHSPVRRRAGTGQDGKLTPRALADALSLKFSRIQFTPDLMPADITGTNIIQETKEGGRQQVFQEGPIFSQ